MRKLIVSELVTLDGIMEAPGGEPGHPHTGWAVDFMGEAQVQYKFDEVLAADSLLIGRITYESFAEGWAKRTGPFADRMNGMPKHVVSTTLRTPTWNNCVVIRDGIAGAVAALKTSDGGPILVNGSRALVHTLMEHELVDEFRLMIFPVTVGSGRRLFPETPRKTTLDLSDTHSFRNGVVVHTYRLVSRSA
jgi:dihydrofolate reductase